MSIKIKIKKLSKNSVLPTYSKYGDAGMDLTATHKDYDNEGNVVYKTGLAFEIPEGFVGLLFPRSSNAKKDLLLSNGVGVLDSGYRGEVMLKYKRVFNLIEFGKVICDENQRHVVINDYNVGDKIGQLIILPYPQIEFEEVEELSETERSEGGFGSTGK